MQVIEALYNYRDACVKNNSMLSLELSSSTHPSWVGAIDITLCLRDTPGIKSIVRLFPVTLFEEDDGMSGTIITKLREAL